MSKLTLFDFSCSQCNHKFEELVNPSERTAPCPQCKGLAQRDVSAPTLDYLCFALSDGASPTSVDKFDRVHRQRKAIEDRRYRDHQDYGSAPGAD